MSDTFLEPIIQPMIHAADTNGRGSLGFENEDTARCVAAMLSFWALGVTNGFKYVVHAEPMNSLTYSHRWQVVIERHETERSAE